MPRQPEPEPTRPPRPGPIRAAWSRYVQRADGGPFATRVRDLPWFLAALLTIGACTGLGSLVGDGGRTAGAVVGGVLGLALIYREELGGLARRRR